jgi:hypothetical protein
VGNEQTKAGETWETEWPGWPLVRVLGLVDDGHGGTFVDVRCEQGRNEGAEGYFRLPGHETGPCLKRRRASDADIIADLRERLAAAEAQVEALRVSASEYNDTLARLAVAEKARDEWKVIAHSANARKDAEKARADTMEALAKGNHARADENAAKWLSEKDRADKAEAALAASMEVRDAAQKSYDIELADRREERDNLCATLENARQLLVNLRALIKGEYGCDVDDVDEFLAALAPPVEAKPAPPFSADFIYRGPVELPKHWEASAVCPCGDPLNSTGHCVRTGCAVCPHVYCRPASAQLACSCFTYDFIRNPDCPVPGPCPVHGAQAKAESLYMAPCGCVLQARGGCPVHGAKGAE